jgi:endonuclease YncB( thermonuclease family)
MADLLEKAMPIPTPVFHAQMLSCFDGDTCKVKLRRNFGDESQKTLRLLEVNCPEMKAKDPSTERSGA